ncbi:MAG TPA: GNAT family N-acetyltransferase [Flavipsychrobacter sp.]|nr:GNAT family N-acetyltransferase [Flavipsychrobacter sp.]
MTVKVSPYTIDDIEMLVPIHMSAFKGYMNSSMGKNYVRKFLQWFLTYPNAITLKAEMEGQICGYVVGAPLNYGSAMNRDLFKTGVIGILTHPGIMIHENFIKAVKAKFKMLIGKKPAKVTINNPEGNGISLISIAVSPKFSGNGVGKEIMKSFEKSAALNMDYMRLSVYDYNTRARAVYEKSGWTPRQQVDKTVYYYKDISNS